MAAGKEEEIKQVIIVRMDIDLGKGKLAAQVAHASLMSYFDAEKRDKQVAKRWLDTGERKIVLKIPEEESLIRLHDAFKYKKVPCALVTDAGLTQVPPGTMTALGIGPWFAKEIDQFTDKLKLL